MVRKGQAGDGGTHNPTLKLLEFAEGLAGASCSKASASLNKFRSLNLGHGYSHCIGIDLETDDWDM
jgi:hypothetical protein